MALQPEQIGTWKADDYQYNVKEHIMVMSTINNVLTAQYNMYDIPAVVIGDAVTTVDSVAIIMLSVPVKRIKVSVKSLWTLAGVSIPSAATTLPGLVKTKKTVMGLVVVF